MADRHNLLRRADPLRRHSRPGGAGSPAFVAGYAFDIRPATDDRPYFSTSSAGAPCRRYGRQRGKAMPVCWTGAGQCSSLAALGVAILFALVLIAAAGTAGSPAGPTPACDTRHRRLLPADRHGFVFLEIATLQRLFLLLGDHPSTPLP